MISLTGLRSAAARKSSLFIAVQMQFAGWTTALFTPCPPLKNQQELQVDRWARFALTILQFYDFASNDLIATFEASIRHCRRSSGSTVERFVFDSRIRTKG